jgi:hypothetical protein
MRAFLAFVVCTALLLYPAEIFAQSDEICCTWINTEYASGDRPQKMIFNYDGTLFRSGPMRRAYSGIRSRCSTCTVRCTNSRG